MAPGNTTVIVIITMTMLLKVMVMVMVMAMATTIMTICYVNILKRYFNVR